MTGLSFRNAPAVLAGIFFLLTVPLRGQTYYVSPDGLPGNAGTLESPTSITRVNTLAAPGVTVYLRGGTYAIASTLGVARNGTADQRIGLLAYPAEHPVLDGDAMPIGGSNRVINLSGSYWTLTGLEIMRAGDNGMRITGSTVCTSAV